MKSKKPHSKEPGTVEPALPSWKAFVMQLSHDTTPDSGIFAGRIEHLGSGRRRRFASGKELLSTVMRLLSDLDPSSKDQDAKGVSPPLADAGLDASTASQESPDSEKVK